MSEHFLYRKISTIAFVGLLAFLPFISSAALAAKDTDYQRRLKSITLPKQLGIPLSMATVQESYKGNSKLLLPEYILIEDIHSHPEAQGKIAALILYAHHHLRSQRVLVEGAFAEVGPPPFPMFTVERGQLSANELLRRGQLSGGELGAALISHSEDSSHFKVIGVDDRQLYRRQLESYQSLMALQPTALRQLRKRYFLMSSRQRDLLTHLLELKLSPGEYDMYLRVAKDKEGNSSLSRAIHLAESYYRLADLRSYRFLQRAPALVPGQPCMIVVGGFHMPAMTQELKRQKKSFVLLTPHITQSDPGNLYKDRLRESYQATHRPSSGGLCSSALASLRLSLGRHRSPQSDSEL